MSALGLVLCGLDVLIRDDFAPLAGRKIGLITNHTGRSRDGRHAVDLFFGSSRVQLRALFAPEHGIRGEKDEAIVDEKDAKTGLPVYSLYKPKEKGDARFMPSPEQLKGLDTLVFDIQDAGARFYTYTSTMGYAMQAASSAGLRFVVLDRPNPITGMAVEGNVSEPEFRGITAFLPVPTRHGMTAGELALYYKSELNLQLDLQIIKCEGWKRSMWYDETGLPWTNPSPNLRSMNAATLYTGLCLLEATNISVGRGTDQPFERIGAPYLDGVAFAREVNALGLPGISVYPVRFVPATSAFSGQECQGIQFIVTDRRKLKPVRLGFELARILAGNHAWHSERLVNLVMNRRSAAALQGSGVPKEWEDGLAAFKIKRKRCLLYD